MPVYNGEKYIDKAISSVILQSFTEWELLVIDDGSKDGTKNIVENFLKSDTRIKYIKNEVNLGIQKTLNRGLREATGIYIARIDDDDIWVDTEKLKDQIEFLETNKEYVLVGTGAVVVDEMGRELARFLMSKEDQNIRNKMLSKNCFIHSSVVFIKSAALHVNGYGESIDVRHIEDYDLWLKLGVLGKFYNVPRYAVSLMQRSNTISAQNRVTQAWRSFREIHKFRSLYPKYLSACAISLLRLLFFSVQIILPFDETFINKIKARYKN